jgi:acetyltransferase-like isoleucine patch superfamily enzyme
MIGDLAWLWSHREKPNSFRRWCVVWLKRLLQLRRLFVVIARAAYYRHKGARIGKLVSLGLAKIGGHPSNLSVGSESTLGRCEISLHGAVTIGARVVVNDGALLLSASHDVADPRWKTVIAPILIGDYAWVASNAILLPGTVIGEGAVVGAGAVVRGFVAPYTVVVGNPSTQTSRIRQKQLAYSPVLRTAPFEAWVGRVESH